MYGWKASTKLLERRMVRIVIVMKNFRRVEIEY